MLLCEWKNILHLISIFSEFSFRIYEFWVICFRFSSEMNKETSRTSAITIFILNIFQLFAKIFSSFGPFHFIHFKVRQFSKFFDAIFWRRSFSYPSDNILCGFLGVGRLDLQKSFYRKQNILWCVNILKQMNVTEGKDNDWKTLRCKK